MASASCTSLHGLIASICDRVAISRSDVRAIGKLAPLAPEQIEPAAELIAKAGYDKLARLMLKIVAVDDANLHKAAASLLLNLFIRIFAGGEAPAGPFLEPDNVARLARAALAGRLPAAGPLSKAARQQLVVALFALYWLVNGPEKTWLLHDRVILPRLAGDSSAMLAAMFQPGLKVEHDRQAGELAKALARRDEWRARAEALAGRLEQCKSENADLHERLCRAETALDQAAAAREELAQALAAREVAAANRLQKRQGQFAAAIAASARLLEGGLAALRSGRAEAAGDHIERGLENLAAALKMAEAAPGAGGSESL